MAHRLYNLNVVLSEAFYTPLHTLEIVLRNKVDVALIRSKPDEVRAKHPRMKLMSGKSPPSATSRRAIESRLKRTLGGEPSSLDGADRGGGGLSGRSGTAGRPAGVVPLRRSAYQLRAERLLGSMTTILTSSSMAGPDPASVSFQRLPTC